MADLRGLLDHSTREITLAIAGVFGRRLAPREIDAMRESLAALIRIMADMPRPVPRLPPEPPRPPSRTRKHARWVTTIDESLITTNPGFRMRGKLPPE